MTDEFKAKITELLKMTGAGVLEGWTTAERGIKMAQLVLDKKPNVIVEIGVFGGRSLIAQAMALRENGHGKIYGIDPWKKELALEGDSDPENIRWWAAVDLHDIHRKCMEAIWEHRLDSWITVIRSASQDAHHLFSGGIDILSIDGNHSELASCRDVQMYAPKLNEGASVLMDDCDWSETKKAQHMLLEYCNLVETDGKFGIYQKK